MEGTDEEKRRAFRETFVALRRRIELLVALPLDELNGPALRRRLEGIGRS